MSVHNVTLYRITEEFMELRVEADSIEEAIEEAKKKSWRATWAMVSSYVRNAVVTTTDGNGKTETVNVSLNPE